MSNVIKSYTVRYETKGKMTLDYKDRDEELQAKRLCKLPLPQIEDGFEEGLQAVVVDPLISNEEEKKKAGAIILNAEKEAAAILEAAKEEAERLIDDAREKAKKQGYEEGISSGTNEIKQLKNKLLKQQEMQKIEYQEILAGIEGQVAELMISMITKLTGIFVEDKNDIILYLVKKALTDGDSAENYTIRVSREDIDLLSSKKEYIEGIIGRDIQIAVDPQLTKNQCLIETDNKVIDCSLDVQLNNLITDIKLLSRV
ncbi:MAG: hypothetical protein EWM47_09065 [Anaerolineaceae bacterium]|nr:MAG: hypothetical protein EWM47_09065 [Anaerolineaceae bacterium]